MPQPTRRSAGADVAARARRLSDDLLAVEESSLANIERAFVDAVPAAQRAVTTATNKTLTVALGDGVQVDTLVRLVEGVMRKVKVEFAALVDVSRAMAQESISEELLLCESTLSQARYAGLTADAMALSETVLDGIVTAAIDAFAVSCDQSIGWFRGQLTGEWSAAVLYAEDAEKVTRRLLSPTQVTAPGHVGRGLWWRTYSQVAESTRGKEIWLVNGIRKSAMSAFNTLGDQR